MTEKEILQKEKRLQKQEQKAIIIHKRTGSIIPLIALQDQIEAFHDELEANRSEDF